MARKTKTVREVVDATIRAEFAELPIDAILVTETEGWQGDPILLVTVLLDPWSSPDVKKKLGLNRRLRPALAEIGNSAFPVVSFGSRAEHDAVNAAA